MRKIPDYIGRSVALTAKMIETYVMMRPEASDTLLLKLHRDG